MVEVVLLETELVSIAANVAHRNKKGSKEEPFATAVVEELSRIRGVPLS